MTEVQQELPLEQQEEIATTKEASPEVKTEVVEATVETTVETVVTNQATETVEPETASVVTPVAIATETADTNTNAPEEKVEVKVKPAKKAAPVAKKSAPKDKKLARQVKKANRLSGRATAPMTKTETITTIKDIPTSFMADNERLAHQSSGRTAITADVVNRSSAQATKP